MEVLSGIENQCYTMTRSSIPGIWARETHADKTFQSFPSAHGLNINSARSITVALRFISTTRVYEAGSDRDHRCGICLKLTPWNLQTEFYMFPFQGGPLEEESLRMKLKIL